MKFSALAICVAVGSTSAFSHASGRRTISRGSLLSSTLEEAVTKVEEANFPVATKTTQLEVSEPIVTILDTTVVQPTSQNDVFVPANTAPDTSRIHP